MRKKQAEREISTRIQRPANEDRTYGRPDHRPCFLSMRDLTPPNLRLAWRKILRRK